MSDIINFEDKKNDKIKTLAISEILNANRFIIKQLLPAENWWSFYDYIWEGKKHCFYQKIICFGLCEGLNEENIPYSFIAPFDSVIVFEPATLIHGFVTMRYNTSDPNIELDKYKDVL